MVTTFTLAHSVLIEGVFWVTVAFVIFFVLFGKRLWIVIAGMLDARTSAIEKEIAEAGRLRDEAEAMLKDAEARRRAALEEARALLQAAKAEAEHLTAQAAAEAQAAAGRRERLAIERIAAAEKAAVSQVRIAAVEVATAAAAEVISRELDAAQDATLVNHAIATLPGALRAG